MSVGRNGSPGPELYTPDGIQKAFPKDKSTRFACKGICASAQPAGLRAATIGAIWS